MDDSGRAFVRALVSNECNALFANPTANAGSLLIGFESELGNGRFAKTTDDTVSSTKYCEEIENRTREMLSF